MPHTPIWEIPKQSGWSGFLLGGVNAVSYKSNFYAGDDSNSRINDLGSPDSESGLTPLINADIRYTFADTRTQVFLGNLIQDAIRFDFTQQLGLRQEMGDKGIVATSLVFNAMPVELWSDPFATNVDRSSTDVKSKGFASPGTRSGAATSTAASPAGKWIWMKSAVGSSMT